MGKCDFNGINRCVCKRHHVITESTDVYTGHELFWVSHFLCHKRNLHDFLSFFFMVFVCVCVRCRGVSLVQNACMHVREWSNGLLLKGWPWHSHNIQEWRCRWLMLHIYACTSWICTETLFLNTKSLFLDDFKCMYARLCLYWVSGKCQYFLCSQDYMFVFYFFIKHSHVSLGGDQCLFTVCLSLQWNTFAVFLQCGISVKYIKYSQSVTAYIEKNPIIFYSHVC